MSPYTILKVNPLYAESMHAFGFAIPAEAGIHKHPKKKEFQVVKVPEERFFPLLYRTED